MTQNTAAVATGALYIDAYFKEADKNASVKLVNNLLVEYMTSIDKSDWMDLKTRQSAKHIAMNMKKFIGYADELRTDVAIKYYDDLFDHSEEDFLKMGLAFKVFETDREYRRLIQKSGSDWAKYSKPASVNAYYKSEDESIRKLNHSIDHF